eukprot:3776186-Rhodomonas_salina.1
MINILIIIIIITMLMLTSGCVCVSAAAGTVLDHARSQEGRNSRSGLPLLAVEFMAYGLRSAELQDLLGFRVYWFSGFRVSWGLGFRVY